MWVMPPPTTPDREEQKMTRYQVPTLRRMVYRLRPSPESLAGVAAAVDQPWLLLQLKALHRGQVGR
jgi:hypothetical protein